MRTDEYLRHFAEASRKAMKEIIGVRNDGTVEIWRKGAGRRKRIRLERVEKGTSSRLRINAWRHRRTYEIMDDKFMWDLSLPKDKTNIMRLAYDQYRCYIPRNNRNKTVQKRSDK